MLGIEPDIVADFVAAGAVELVFWPVLNHGQPSVNATLANHCLGIENPAAFWPMHHALFEQQDALWRADYGFYLELALSFGADADTFAACYGSDEAIRTIQSLDRIRQERGVFGQPYFEINGNLFAGAPPYEVFADVLRAAAP